MVGYSRRCPIYPTGWKVAPTRLLVNSSFLRTVSPAPQRGLRHELRNALCTFGAHGSGVETALLPNNTGQAGRDPEDLRGMVCFSDSQSNAKMDGERRMRARATMGSDMMASGPTQKSRPASGSGAITGGGVGRKKSAARARLNDYGGVIRSVREPAVIAISGIGPIHYHPTDPSKPGWRQV
jgi:hypothetical protein